MKDTKFHLIGITLGIFIFASSVYYPPLVYLYMFLLAALGIAAVEHLLTMKVYSVIKKHQKKGEQ